MEMFSQEKKRRLDIIYRTFVGMMIAQGKNHVTFLDTPSDDKKDAALSQFFKPSTSREWHKFKSFENLIPSDPPTAKDHNFTSRLAYCSIFSTIDGTPDLSRRGDDLKNDTVVVFLEEKESNQREAKDIISQIIEYDWKKIYIISPVELTSHKKKIVENSRLAGLSVIPYVDYQLAISVLKHVFSPITIKRYPASKIREFKDVEKIEPSLISLLKQVDPIARSLNLSRGDIIIETVPGTNTETDIVYRKVVL